MTEEEKAEEYVNSKGFGYDYNNITSSEANEEIEKAVLYGLAEGRKDGYSKGLDTFPNTRRENRELIDKLNLQNQRLNELKKENEELKEKLKVLENSDFNSLFDPDELDNPHENEIFEG